jgi:hypothetical protein
MVPSIDVTLLAPTAQRIVNPSSAPNALRALAARGLAPGLRPGDALAVVCVLALQDGDAAPIAQHTLANLPDPLFLGAMAGDLQPGVLHALGPSCAQNAARAEQLLMHRSVHNTTVEEMAAACNEAVAELIATNEERMLRHPAIIEQLYLNKSTRMSTADRILELAIRHGLDCSAIKTFEQAKQALLGELIAEPTEGPSFDDVQFNTAHTIAETLELADDEDTHAVDSETGEERVVFKAKPLHAVWSELRGPAKIRLLTLGTAKVVGPDGKTHSQSYDLKAIRQLGVRDPNPLVAVAALKSPGMNDSEIERISKMRNVCEEVLRDIALSRNWTRSYTVKLNLCFNPRTPLAHALTFLQHLRDSDLKALLKSKDVRGDIQGAAKRQLSKKAK